MVVWTALAVIGSAIMLLALVRIGQALRPDPDLAHLPMTGLEKLGWIGLAVSAGIMAGIAILVAIAGVEGFHQERGARVTFWILLMVGIAAWWTGWMALRRRHGSVVMDERDRAVLARSFSVESMVVLLALVAWTVGLTEAFWDEGAVPLAYLQLLFWTTFVGGAIGRSVGIILGYRRGVAVDA